MPPVLESSFVSTKDIYRAKKKKEGLRHEALLFTFFMPSGFFLLFFC